eukprot:757158-Prymnesium_polylepis.1
MVQRHLHLLCCGKASHVSSCLLQLVTLERVLHQLPLSSGAVPDALHGNSYPADQARLRTVHGLLALASRAVLLHRVDRRRSCHTRGSARGAPPAPLAKARASAFAGASPAAPL